MKSREYSIMYESFVTTVVVVDPTDTMESVVVFLERAAKELADTFTDYEIVIVDNRSGLDLSQVSLAEQVRQHCYVIILAHHTSWDLAVWAGLDRANGDFTLVYDVTLAERLPLVKQMYEVAQSGKDFVVLRRKRGSKYHRLPLSGRAFFFVMRWLSDVKLNPMDGKELLISRRALNWLLRYRSRWRFINEIYVSAGYQVGVIEVDIPVVQHRRSAVEKGSLAWSALARMSRLPLRAAEAAIAIVSGVMVLLSLNAVTVRLFDRNLFGQPETIVPGWSYLVILISLGFIVTNISIYLVIRILTVISEDIRDTPLYVVEQYKRL